MSEKTITAEELLKLWAGSQAITVISSKDGRVLITNLHTLQYNATKHEHSHRKADKRYSERWEKLKDLPLSGLHVVIRAEETGYNSWARPEVRCWADQWEYERRTKGADHEGE